jgi:hypothetical protein
MPPATQPAPVPHEIDFVGANRNFRFGLIQNGPPDMHDSSLRIGQKPGYLSGASIV